ncbi:DUF3450 domain-containing protein [Nitrosococcus wardiae]|uniref:DUF3450 domain-containing protein n=2 Tax=Nitrosococcus wardiae TaxID=1814290 RepID=A0A4P7C3Q7_9GAMM|nr:DUF3450 domain-containing protein [Nitrosococcus wardiae]
MIPFSSIAAALPRVAFLVGCFLLWSGVQADSLDNLAEELIRMRSEVEELQSQLDLEKEKHKNRMEVLSSQLAELSTENRRLSLSVEQLHQTFEEHRQQLSHRQSGETELLPVMLKAVDYLQDYVRTGLPFKVEGRLRELEQLHTQLKTGVLDPKKSANRIWAFIEDEVRLSKENGIYRQTIQLDGENNLAEVAKIGMMLLFFQTEDSRVGMAQQDKDHWRFVVMDTEQDRKHIVQLFDSLKKQIRQGYFELPNPLES